MRKLRYGRGYQHAYSKSEVSAILHREKNGYHKGLGPAFGQHEVRKIRRLYVEQGFSTQALAKRYKVSQATIYRVLTFSAPYEAQ